MRLFPSHPRLASVSRYAAALALALVLVTLALPGGAVVAQAQGSEGLWYTVVWGDTLGRIAARHGVMTNAIIAANDIVNPNVIRIGRRLWIPGASQATPPPTGAPTPTPNPTEPGEGVWYTVVRGDALGRIATRHGTTTAAIMRANNLTNPNLIRIGQRLWIGASAPAGTPTPQPPAGNPTPTPTSTTPASDGVWYTVRSGDTLAAIARRHGSTVSAIVQANSLANANMIRVGQRLWIPGASGSSPQPTQPPSQPTTQPPSQPPASGGTGFSYGFQIQPWYGADVNQALDATAGAGFTWLKIQVPWKQIEGAGKGAQDWGDMDRVVDAISGRGIRLLVSVCKAPDWARSGNTNRSYEGPPANEQDLADFLSALAARYRGRVHAIEVWNEQNLGHEWGGEPIDAGRYVRILCAAYRAIKAQDANMVVVAGGLTPTGVSDGVTAIDDVTYLRSMYAAGCKGCMDALGAHPSGYNNPPTARMGYTDPAEPEFKAHPSFFFQETMTRYREVMVANGDSARRIWPTEFGWASSGSPSPGYEYARNITEQEQAAYLVEALRMMRQWGYVGPAFVWNLNFNVSNPGTEMAQFGVMGRPAYDALRNIPK